MTTPERTPVPAEEILASLGEAVFVCDLDGCLLTWNRAAEAVFGWSAGEAIGQDVVELLHAEVEDGAVAELVASLTSGSTVFGDFWTSTRSGVQIPVLCIMTPLSTDDGVSAVAVVAIDMRARRAAEERFRLGFEQSAIPTAMIGIHTEFVGVNPALMEYLGMSESELLGRSALDFIHPDDRDPQIIPRIGRGEIERTTLERRIVLPNGEVAYGLVSLSPVRDRTGRVAFVYTQVQDITERKQAEQALVHLALHDPLTGLPNRALIEDRLGRALVRARADGRPVVVVLGDIDRFQIVNDTLGHSAGDQVLVEVAERLRHATRAADTIGRFGGDEFVLITEGADPEATPSELSSGLTGRFAQPFDVDGQQLFVTASCGVVIAQPDDTPESLLRDADSAVAMAKRLGRNRTELFHQQLHSRTSRLFDLESSLRQAITRDELYMAFQPIVDLPTGRPCALEALMRWRQADGTEVAPGEFIPVAEESDLILTLGEFALEQAVSALAHWQETLPAAAELKVAVNLSSRQLTADLVPLCASVLVRHHLRGSSLILEITEGSVMADVEESIRVLSALRELGITIAVDDFGTGQSSLEYLRRLPLDTLKVDRSFITGLGTGPKESAIVRAIVDLASALGLETCAEGVERVEQYQELVALGCRLGQGYWWERPMEPSRLGAWLASLPTA